MEILMKQLFYLFVLLPLRPGAMTPVPERGVQGSTGTSRFLSSCSAPDTDPPFLRQSYILPSGFLRRAWILGWVPSTVYRLPCTLQHWLNVNMFSLSVGSSTRRRTKVSAVIQNLINIKPQKHTPGLDAFPSHPCPLDRGAILAGVEEAALLSSPSGMCLVPTFQVGFSYCYFLITCILRMMLSFEFLKKWIGKTFYYTAIKGKCCF